MHQVLIKSLINLQSLEKIIMKKVMIDIKEVDIKVDIEVDIKYPKHLHDLHSDLPLLPERMKISPIRLCVIHIIKTIMLFI